MTDRLFFLDSNVVLYALSDDSGHATVAQSLLNRGPVLSAQVFNECSAVMRRKLRLPIVRVRDLLEPVMEMALLVPTGLDTVKDAWRIAERYGYGHYDSLIVASALAAGCDLVFSEDLQHGQVIDGRLAITNPFV